MSDAIAYYVFINHSFINVEPVREVSVHRDGDAVVLRLHKMPLLDPQDDTLLQHAVAGQVMVTLKDMDTGRTAHRVEGVVEELNFKRGDGDQFYGSVMVRGRELEAEFG